MKKIILVRLDKACDPEVGSLKDVVEFVKQVAASEEVCECECKSKKKSDESSISKEALDLISTIAEDLGIDVEQLKKDVIEEKYKADAKRATEAAIAATKAKEEAVAKTNKAKPNTPYEAGIYETGAIYGYEKGFKDCIEFIRSRLNKSITATLSDLNDMAKWNFKDGTLKEDAVFKK